MVTRAVLLASIALATPAIAAATPAQVGRIESQLGRKVESATGRDFACVYASQVPPADATGVRIHVVGRAALRKARRIVRRAHPDVPVTVARVGRRYRASTLTKIYRRAKNGIPASERARIHVSREPNGTYTRRCPRVVFTLQPAGEVSGAALGWVDRFRRRYGRDRVLVVKLPAGVPVPT